MSTILDRFITANPLLGHGPRTHDTGIALVAAEPSQPRRRPARRDVDAPRIHLGRDPRAS